MLRDQLGNPLKIGGRVITALRECEEKGLFDQLRENGHRLKPGQAVRVTGGPFAGFDAVIRSVRDSTNVSFLKFMFGG